MKIPLLWLQDYISTDKSPREIANSFTQLGLMLDKPLDDSGILDLEHRMDRSDWLSIIGCARDYAAFNRLKLKYPKSNTKKLPQVKSSEMVEITVNTPAVRRFNTRLVKNVQVAPSPAWLKERLEAYGIKSINNVVDITNFVMVEYGQTLHAQDLAKLKKREITIRPAKPGESVTTLLGTNVILDKNTFILSSGGVPTVIGGIVGGLVTSVTNSTTELILDAGNYDQSVIRKNSRRLKIINESVSRNDKFIHPDLCEIALDRATYLLETIAGATVYHNFDYYPSPAHPSSRTLTFTRLKLLSGLDIPLKDVKRILTALEYQITDSSKDSLTLTIPFFRTDVEVEDDIIADILRLSDYTNIPTAPLTTPVPSDITPPILKFEDRLRDLLVAAGAHEHITTSLVQQTGQKNEVMLSNALSCDQNALRLSLVPKLTEVLSNYRKHKITNSTVFEIGTVFSSDQPGVYREIHDLAVVANTDVRDNLATLMANLGVKYLVDQNHNILVDAIAIGVLGPNYYRLNTEDLNKSAQQYQGVIGEFTHQLSRDLSLLLPRTVTFYDLAQIIKQIDPEIVTKVKSTTQVGDQLNYLLNLTWANSSVDADHLISQINQSLKKQLGVTSKS